LQKHRRKDNDERQTYSLAGLNLRVDPVKKELIDAGPILAVAAV